MNCSNTIASVRKKSSHDVFFINSMARLHNLLCDIVDDLNACFSIQVFKIKFKLIIQLKFFFKLLNVCGYSPDNVQHWILFVSVDFLRLLFASDIFL